MNRLSASPERKPLIPRVPTPVNQWPTRSVPPFGPQFATQRLFTPQSSYFSQTDDSFVFSQSLNMNHNFGQHYNYGPYESPPMRPMPYAVPDTNRPVYSTPDQMSHIERIANQIPIQDLNQFKAALESVHKPKVETERKSFSPESTVSSGESGSQSMNKLINDMKKMTEDQEVKKKTRKDVEKKISELDEELKEFERKINFRDQLRKVKEKLESEEELIETQKKELLSEMERCSKRHGFDTNETKPMDVSEVPKSSTTAPVPQKDNNTIKSSKCGHLTTGQPQDRCPKCNTDPINAPIVPKPAIKRPNPTNPSKPNPIKKVRIMDDKTDSSNTTPKNLLKPPIRRTPLPPKSSTSMGSPKVDRICRQPNPTSATPMTSGVRTSRPTKMMSSRTKRLEDTNPSNAQKTSEPTTESSSVKQTANNDSDNEVFKELNKLNVENLMNTPIDGIQQKTSETISKSGESDTNLTENRSQSEDQSSNDNQTTQPTDDRTANQSNPEPNATKDKVIEVVDIDSGDEDFSEETNIQIKTEKSDPSEDLTSKPQESNESNNNIESHPSRASETSDTSVETNSKDSSHKSVHRKVYQFCAFDSLEMEPTTTYMLATFKPVAGPKSKTAKTRAILLKPFKDYLIVSFNDFTVRRYHFEDKKNVIKYEGHESIVLTMIIIKCSKTADTFILYTGGKDKKVRAFDAISGQFLNSIEMSDEIYCLDSQWSHIFCALNDGLLCKIPFIHENIEKDFSEEIRKYVVNCGKKVVSIVCVKCVEPSAEDIQPVIALTQNKMRVIDVRDSVDDQHRVLSSTPMALNLPAALRAFGDYLFVSYKIPPVKTEDKDLSKKEIKSRLHIFDLKMGIKEYRKFVVEDNISSIDICGNELIVSSYSGKIQSIDCTQLITKWFAFSERKVTGAVLVGDRLVVGTDEGQIECIYLDQQFITCDNCGLTFGRQIDLKKHIQTEHKVEDQIKVNNRVDPRLQ